MNPLMQLVKTPSRAVKPSIPARAGVISRRILRKSAGITGLSLDSQEWPRRKERHYSLVPTTWFNCESACGLLTPNHSSPLDNYYERVYRHPTMSAALDALAHEALALPPDQRLALARRLLDSVDLEPEPGAEAAWQAEIARRIARFDAGESKPIPASEVFALLRQTAPDR